jgi:hypothetical protein
VRILDELEPGAIFSLWRASIGRYVLDEARSQQLFEEFYIWDDFPSTPGEVSRCFSAVTDAAGLSVIVAADFLSF